MNGAGMRPWGLLQPFIAVTMIASLMLTAIGAYLAPESLRMLRRWITEVRADLVSNIVQPGRFTAIEQGLAFYIRERRPNGLLVGLMIDDRRDPAQRVTILAEHGEMVKNDKRQLPDAARKAASSGTRRSSAIRTSSCSIATLSTCRNSPAAPRSSNTRSASAICGN